MVRIECNVCGAEKPTNEKNWILGYDLEVESPHRMSRSVTFLDHWDDRRVLEFGAIHLCSEQCKSEYVAGARAVA